MTKTLLTTKIKDRLDEILTDYMSLDNQISAGLSNDSQFFGSLKYYELCAQKAELGKAHTKLTDALVAIESYL